MVRRDTGLLVNDDSTLDKPYARKMELVTRPWSGKHHRVVRGITLSTLLWTDGDTLVPTDFRVYDKADGLTKNEHFRAMLGTAHALRMLRLLVLEPGDPLKVVRGYLWRWLTRLKGNRLVNPDESGNVAVSEVERPTEGRVVHLKGYGMKGAKRLPVTASRRRGSGCCGRSPQTATWNTGPPTTDR